MFVPVVTKNDHMLTKEASCATCKFTQANSTSIVPSVERAGTTVGTTGFTWINMQAYNTSVITAQNYSI